MSVITSLWCVWTVIACAIAGAELIERLPRRVSFVLWLSLALMAGGIGVLDWRTGGGLR